MGTNSKYQQGFLYNQNALTLSNANRQHLKDWKRGWIDHTIAQIALILDNGAWNDKIIAQIAHIINKDRVHQGYFRINTK